ncbi:hypothetical protein PCANC_23475 [Puccinia coronata f. sp. avenae]|uniref:Uncharacterized protein n=1 Tax=Puccinia coronata f. sp. avenae TaxID=200324 RepID=A0A2N5S3K1_9BASI|nr:hypothetical protein PCANC_26380 [Puccinia coronata f. sp. avenae]PLW07809.1 hypothetical protein PCASD_24379 [Puccinia coronata f. sp. avenae]PLW29100.1 hypothetical protein PCANC_23475 [Puccinia coronata f. sp. avenae]PLW32246.1 hypothetical protein PCASD_17834 [Puccinia coronata f. sp. avenae]
MLLRTGPAGPDTAQASAAQPWPPPASQTRVTEEDPPVAEYVPIVSSRWFGPSQRRLSPQHHLNHRAHCPTMNFAILISP